MCLYEVPQTFSYFDSIIWGVIGQQKRVYSKDLLKSDLVTQNIWAVYMQDMLKVFEKLSVIPAVRCDYHPLMKGVISYRLGFVYALTNVQNIRMAYSKAYRSSTFNETYMEYYAGTVLYAVGNEDLNPMTIDSLEIGYNTIVSNRVKIDIAVFQNDMANFILRNYAAKPIGFVNAGKTRGIGGEVAFDIKLNNWLDSKLNYSYAKMEVIEESDAIWGEKQTPKNQVGMELSVRNNKMSANVQVSYVSAVEWNVAGWGGGKADAYTVVNARLAYEITEGIETAISGFNLLGEHYEYPAVEIARKIMGSFSYKF